MPKLAVLLWITLLCSIGAMSAYGSGAKDQIDLALTADVEALLEQPELSEFAGLEPIHPAAGIGPAFVEIPLIIDEGDVPLSDLDALYGVDGPPVVVLPAPVAPVVVAVPVPAPSDDLVEDTPAIIASVWSNPPLDIK